MTEYRCSTDSKQVYANAVQNSIINLPSFVQQIPVVESILPVQAIALSEFGPAYKATYGTTSDLRYDA